MSSLRREKFLTFMSAVVLSTSAALACTVDGGQIACNGEPFRVQGANYYPKDYSWDRFWPNYAAIVESEIESDLTMAEGLGVNTLRIFLLYGQFEDNTSPYLDDLVDFLNRLAAHNLKALITLFDLYPSDGAYPYCDSLSPPCSYEASKRHVDAALGAVGNHPAVLGWDLKNEPDLDYDVFSATTVKNWIQEMITYLRGNTDRLITLGFSGGMDGVFNPEVPAEFACEVDFVSFHYFGYEGSFQTDVEALKDAIDAEVLSNCPGKGKRPILLEEFGLHTFDAPTYGDPHTEEEQAAYYNAVLSLAEAANLAGSIFWTLTDYSYILGFSFFRDSEHCLGILRNSTPWTECSDPPHCSCEVSDPVDSSEKSSADVVRWHFEDLFYLDLFNCWVDAANQGTPPGWTDNYTPTSGAAMNCYDPCLDELKSHTPGHAAITKTGTTGIGFAWSPMLHDVEIERFPILSGRISSYHVKNPGVDGGNAELRITVQENDLSPVDTLRTVAPTDSMPVVFHLDLRTLAGWPGACTSSVEGKCTFRIVFEIEPVDEGHAYSASYELDWVSLHAGNVLVTQLPEGIFEDDFGCGDTRRWSTVVP